MKFEISPLSVFLNFYYRVKFNEKDGQFLYLNFPS